MKIIPLTVLRGVGSYLIEDNWRPQTDSLLTHQQFQFL